MNAEAIRKMPKGVFLDTVANMADFNYNNMEGGEHARIPEDTCWNVSYVIACFYAQRLPQAGGVETEVPLEALKMRYHLTFAARRELAEKLYKELAKS